MPQIPPDLALERAPFDLETLDRAVDELEHGDGTVDVPESATGMVRRWEIADDGAAEWALRHLAAIEHERAAIQEQADLWFDQIHQWLNGELARVRPRAEFFEGHLKRYGLQVRADDPRRATVSLPSGKISTRVPSGPVADVEDEEKVIEWAAGSLTDEDYAAVIRTTQKALIVELRKRVVVAENDGGALVVWRDSGEPVPGLAARQAETTATVTPAQ